MAVSHANVITIAGSTPISTSSYSNLVASTPIPFFHMVIANSTDTDIRLAYGTSGSQIDYVAVGTGQTVVVEIGINIIPVGTSLWVEAIGNASTKGNFTVTLVP